MYSDQHDFYLMKVILRKLFSYMFSHYLMGLYGYWFLVCVYRPWFFVCVNCLRVLCAE
jgi:hypothetical protein